MSDSSNIQQEATFKAAADYLSSRKDLKFDNQTLLQLYALFKLATVGPCNTPKPGLFELTGRAKWDAWNSLGNVPKDEAMDRYVAIVKQLTKWEPGTEESIPSMQIDTPSSTTSSTSSNSSTSSSKEGMGVSVSTMVSPRENIRLESIFSPSSIASLYPLFENKDKTIFQWAEEGNTSEVLGMLNRHEKDINDVDEAGMTVLHWASDRGHMDLASTLLQRGASPNAQDLDGQTPLHYAVTVEHSDLVRLLATSGANASVEDVDGQSAMEAASSEMRAIIEHP
ncbi:Enoyl-CoA delta isomerase 2, mitochondrial [Rhizophlyctis rosea]|nr:Enoyl-CoA delta isomerase 2, mitochondrial [Rhizophlyctis rosea]